MITNDGLNLIKRRLVSNVDNPISSAGLGTSNTAPSLTDTGLNGNTNLGIASSIQNITISNSNNQTTIFDYILSASSLNGSTIYEFGVDNGTYLFDRVVFAAMTKSSLLTWQFTKRLFYKNG